MAGGRPYEGARSRDRAPLVALVLVLVLGLAAGVASCLALRGPRSGTGGSEPAPPIVLPERADPLATRLAVVLLQGVGDEVFDETGVMPTLRDCAERGESGSFAPGGLAWTLAARGDDPPRLLETAGIPLLRHGGLRFSPAGPVLPGRDRESSFDEAVLAALDARPWLVFFAGLAPETAVAAESPLFLDGTRNPTGACFALSALDHELRRLLLHVGSHLTLLVIREGATRADWTLSGPGADDPPVLEAMNEGAVARALLLLLGFVFD